MGSVQAEPGSPAMSSVQSKGSGTFPPQLLLSVSPCGRSRFILHIVSRTTHPGRGGGGCQLGFAREGGREWWALEEVAWATRCPFVKSDHTTKTQRGEATQRSLREEIHEISGQDFFPRVPLLPPVLQLVKGPESQRTPAPGPLGRCCPSPRDASLGLWERSGLARLQLGKPVGHPLPSVPESS